MTSPRIQAVGPTSLADLDGSVYDGVLASLGFERRSREIPEALVQSTRRAAVPFLDRHSDSFGENENFFAEGGWDVPGLSSEDESVAWIMDWVGECGETLEVQRIAIDVSSMSRVRIAAVVESMMELPAGAELTVDLLYTPSVFRPPEVGGDPPVLSIKPVTGYFAGWWSDLDLPLHAVIGLGYELERASSAIDYLEPESVEALVPEGGDARYLEALVESNRALFAIEEVERTGYDIRNPMACFRVLEARVYSLSARHRVALIPLGPKIFAACAMLVAAIHPAAAQVIRVTAEEREEAVDQSSDGNVYGLRVVLGPPREPELADGAAP